MTKRLGFKKQFTLLNCAALGVAGLVTVPILSVLWSLSQPGQGNWPHLVETVLPGYIVNSLVLMVGVAVGVIVLGVGPAWLVVMCKFPGRRLFEWALILPLGIIVLCMPNTQEILSKSWVSSDAKPQVMSKLTDRFLWKPNAAWAVMMAVLLVFAFSNIGSESSFLYYDF